MSENKKAPEGGAQGTSNAEQVWDKVVAETKDKLEDLKDTAQLRMQISKLESRRKKAYTRLGEVTYKRLHAVHGAVPGAAPGAATGKLEEASDRLVTEITNLTHEITALTLKLKMKKLRVKGS